MDEPQPGSHSDSDVRALHTRALEELGVVVEKARATAMDQATPCPEWDVRQLVEHMVGLNLGFAEALRHGTAPEDAYRPRPVEEWQTSVDAVRGAAGAPDERTVLVTPVSAEVPFPPRDALLIHLLDVVVHTWDLCAALGLDHEPAADVVSAVGELAAVVATRPVPSTREQFGAPIRSPQGESSGWPHVLRLLGRRPGWRLGVAAPSLEPVDLRERLRLFSETWSPKVVARVDDYEVKVVKMLGEFEWHTHEDTDELFAVVSGRMRIEMDHGSVTLGPGSLYVVPRGTRHRPVADEPTESVLLEVAGVVNTGDAGGALTAVDEVLV